MHTPRDFLFSLEQIGIKLGLDQIRSLTAALGHPDHAYRSIIVAGTNGKGSVTAMVERALRAAGYRTGRYTSPHLVRLEERFAIDGIDADSRDLDAAIARVQDAAATLAVPPTFFEATTAAALEIFQAARVDVAVLEVGLGGRLDATNVVTPVAAAITAIDFDHQQFLGDTIEAIAAEKAGVIKAGMLAVAGPNPPTAEAVIARRCREVGADLVRAIDGVDRQVEMHEGRATMTLHTPRGTHDAMRLALRGRHQVDNAVAAVRLLEELHARSRLNVPAAAIRSGVEDAVWPGRLELIDVGGSQVLIDGAHNASGARALAAFLAETYARPLPLVLGVLRDKDVDAIAGALAPAASVVVCTAPRSDRALAPADLAAAVARHAPDVTATTRPSAEDALAVAMAHDSPVVVAGSLYLAGEVRALVS